MQHTSVASQSAAPAPLKPASRAAFSLLGPLLAILAGAVAIASAIGWMKGRGREPTWAALQYFGDGIDMDHDYYADLGVRADASQEEIRKAFRKLAREQHPDIAGSKANPARFIAIKRAYDFLSDPVDRQKYNYHRAFGSSRRRAAPQPAPPAASAYNPYNPYSSYNAYSAPPPAQPAPSRSAWQGVVDTLSRGLSVFRRQPGAAGGGAAAAGVQVSPKEATKLASDLLRELNRQGFAEVTPNIPEVERVYRRPYRRWQLQVSTCLKNTRQLTLMDRDTLGARVSVVSEDMSVGGLRIVAGPLYVAYGPGISSSVFISRFRESLRQVQEELGRNVMFGG